MSRTDRSRDEARNRQIAVPFVALLLVAWLTACALPPTSVKLEPTASPVAGNDLEGTEWLLTSLWGKPLLDDTHITLKFGAGRLSGFAGCNSYGGEAESGDSIIGNDGALKIGLLEITVMDCRVPAGVTGQEQTYVEALRGAATYRLAGDRLEIPDAAGETILIVG